MTTTLPSTIPPLPKQRSTNGLGRLIATEAKLFIREPIGLIFVFAFPILTVLIIGSSFAPDDPEFGGASPSDYYIAAYIGVVLAAVGLVMLPVHLASYRERGVLRRFHASHFSSRALPVAWVAVATALSIIAIATLLTTAQIVFGVPVVSDAPMTLLGLALGIWTSINTGIVLGLALPNARAAQGVGLALFFPSILLGGAGPPPAVMSPLMRTAAELIPTTHVVKAIQQPWLNIGSSATPHLIVLSLIGVATTILWVKLAERIATR